MDFIDRFTLINPVLIEGSTGTWEEVEEGVEGVCGALSGKMVGYYEIPSAGPHHRAAIV
ncbi:MAG: hypothetical protein LAN62_06640 [Acidobacteriia bacterium]|nr:hypothetical protein [Terriglobia bacterium]